MAVSGAGSHLAFSQLRESQGKYRHLNERNLNHSQNSVIVRSKQSSVQIDVLVF